MSVTSNPIPNGGAIYSTADTADTHIGNITGNFVGNHVINPMNYSYGGAIFNASARNYLTYIGDIKGNFIGNYLSSQRNTHGGAILQFRWPDRQHYR